MLLVFSCSLPRVSPHHASYALLLIIISVHLYDLLFPAEETPLVPFSLEHLLRLLLNLPKINKWLRPLEEVSEVVDEVLDILCVLVRLFYVERDYIELVEILQPCQIIVTLNEAEFAQLAEPAESEVVFVQVEILPVAFFA